MATRTRRNPEAETSPEVEPTTNGEAPALPSLDEMDESPVSLAEIRREPNPYAGITKDPRVLDAEKPKRLPVANHDQAKKVTALLRRDAQEPTTEFPKGVGFSIDTKELDGKLFVVFRSKSNKRNLEHTSAKIRAWAEQNGLPTEVGQTTNSKGEVYRSTRLPKETRDAYRAAHGLAVSK